MADRPAFFILITIALDALGFGIVIPVEPGLVMQVGHVPASDASFWLGAILTAYSAMQFLAAPVLGALSDCYGRRPVLLASLAALGVGSALTTIAPSLFWLFMVRMFTGATSGNTAAAAAYLADVTPPGQRAQRYGWVGAMYGLGFVLGPAFGGVLGEYGVRVPFLASASLAACNVAYGLLILPESLPPERCRAFDWRRANPVGTWATIFTSGPARRLGFAWCCLWFALGAQQTSFILANQMRFHWNTMQNGLVLAAAGLASAATQGLLERRSEARIGLRRTALAGLALSTLGYLFYAFAFSKWIMFPGVLILALGALANPAVQSMLSTSAGAKYQGEVQGALSSLEGLMAVAAPVAMGGLFEFCTRGHSALHFPGAPFLLAAIVCGAGGIVLFTARGG